MQHEEWRPIEGHPNYEVSNLGNVCCLERLTAIGNGAKRLDKARVMRQQKLGRTGYLQVTLTGHRKFAVHRLVALAFCGFDGGSISRCCHGKIAYHKGYKWEFADPVPQGMEEIRGAA